MDVIDQDYLWIVSTSVSSVERHNCFHSSVIELWLQRGVKNGLFLPHVCCRVQMGGLWVLPQRLNGSI
jgi:hypothetical protein